LRKQSVGDRFNALTFKLLFQEGVYERPGLTILDWQTFIIKLRRYG